MHRQLRPKILIIESQLIIAADISLQFSKLGYDVLGIHTCPEDALATIQGNLPDIIVMNIGLLSKAAGLKAAQTVLGSYQIPLVYLSANTGEAFFKAMIDTPPYAFISKPFVQKDLKRGIEKTLLRIAAERLCSRKLAASTLEYH